MENRNQSPGKIRTLIIYDISDSKKRRKFAVLMESYGRRVQKSAFETSLKGPVNRIMTEKIRNFPVDKEKDSIRMYHMYGAPDTIEKGKEKGIWNAENDVLVC